jgi:hypothetical protein
MPQLGAQGERGSLDGGCLVHRLDVYTFCHDSPARRAGRVGEDPTAIAEELGPHGIREVAAQEA